MEEAVERGAAEGGMAFVVNFSLDCCKTGAASEKLWDSPRPSLGTDRIPHPPFT